MTRTSAWVLLAVTLAFFASPAVTPPFTGYDPGMFPVVIERPAIQPAGYAFAIWGPIFLWLTAHAAFAVWKRYDHPAWAPSRLPLTLAIALGAVWLAIAGGYPITATVVILAMAGLAVTAFLKGSTQKDRWLLSAPMAMFAGWLTAAATVSVGVVLAGCGWLSNTASALVLLPIVLIIALAVQARKPAMPLYGATVVWALVGVAMANWPDLMPVAIAALTGALLVTALTATFARNASLH